MAAKRKSVGPARGKARRLVGAAVGDPIATAGPLPAAQAKPGVGMPMYMGQSNVVPPPPAATGKLPPPEPGSIIVSQVAERWVNEVSTNLQPETLATYLRNAIAGDVFYLFEFFEEMEEKWPTLRGALMRHRLKAVMRRLRVSPPDFVNSPDVAKQKADHMGLQFAQTRDLTRNLFLASDCLPKGISTSEADYQIGSLAGKRAVLLNELRYVNYRHIGWWFDSPEMRLFPNLLNRAAPIIPPDRKFVVFEHLSKSGHPARASVLRPLAWYFLIYLYAIKDWATLAETFGIDVAWATMRIGKDDAATLEQRNKALMALSRIAARAGIFDEGTNINLERAAGGGAPPQESLVKYCNEKAVELILGQTLTTVAPTHGTQALGSVQQEEGDLVIDWTALTISSALTYQISRWLCDFNFAEPGDYPVVELPGANRRDLTALANILNILVGIGVEIPEAWARNQFEVPEAKIGADGQPEKLLKASKAAVQDAPLTNALIGLGTDSEIVHGGNFGTLTERQAQAALDQIIARGIREGRDMGAFEQIAKPIKAVLTGAGDPADAMATLHKVANQIDPSKLQSLGKELFILVDLVGRWSVAQQAGKLA